MHLISSKQYRGLESDLCVVVDSLPSSGGTSPTNSSSSSIECTWPQCGKAFKTTSDYNHHCKNHTRPFQCPSCSSRHPTKRQLHRHINACHLQTEKYYCPIPTCKRSRLKGGRPFPREDNCRKHMRTTLAHRLTSVEEVACDMDQETKRIRMERKVAKRVA